MTAPDLLAALTPVVEALEQLGVPHYIGGSLASSVHGIARSTLDVDVVAGLALVHVPLLVSRLGGTYYLDEERVRQAVLARRSFNLIHLATMLKVDLFVMGERPFDREALRRAWSEPLDDSVGARRFAIASPEDTILAKLDWYRMGGESSQRQWTDVIGMFRAAGGNLDRGYLTTWAEALGVGDLLRRVLAEIP